MFWIDRVQAKVQRKLKTIIKDSSLLKKVRLCITSLSEKVSSCCLFSKEWPVTEVGIDGFLLSFCSGAGVLVMLGGFPNVSLVE